MQRSGRPYFYAALIALPIGSMMANSGYAQDLAGFAVISGESLTNTGPTTINGNIAVSPGTSYTGSGSVTQTGTAFIGDAVAGRIKNDLTTLYNVLAGRPTSSGGDLTGQDLGDQTLFAGVYNFDTSAALGVGKTLTLDGGGDPDSIFIINIGTTLTANSGSEVVLQNGAQGGNVFFRVGSSATLDTTADLVGQIVALTSITMNSEAKVDCGAIFARNGSVTLDTNTIGICTLVGADFDTVPEDADLTDDETSVAAALSDYVSQGGVLPLGFAILAATQTPDELADSLAQMSGKVSTGISPTVLNATDSFLDTVVQSGRGVAATPRASRGVGAPNSRASQGGYDRSPAAGPFRDRRAPRDEGVPVGLVLEKINTPYLGKYDPPPVTVPSFAQPIARQQDWSVWASGYGSNASRHANADRGSPEFSAQDRGFAGGVNFAPSDALNFGAAVSFNAADFNLGDNFGSGSSDTVFVALRTRATSGRGYVEGALAFGKSDIETQRTVTIAGVDRFEGKTTSDTVAAHIEAGYQIGLFTPFVALRAKSVKTDAFSEATTAGSSSYALQYDAETAKSVRSELGVAIDWPADFSRSTPASFGLRASWAQEFASNEPSTRSFLAVPDALFPISGIEQDRDSLILAANMGIAMSNGLDISGSVNATFSNGAEDVGGSISARYQW